MPIESRETLAKRLQSQLQDYKRGRTTEIDTRKRCMDSIEEYAVGKVEQGGSSKKVTGKRRQSPRLVEEKLSQVDKMLSSDLRMSRSDSPMNLTFTTLKSALLNPERTGEDGVKAALQTARYTIRQAPSPPQQSTSAAVLNAQPAANFPSNLPDCLPTPIFNREIRPSTYPGNIYGNMEGIIDWRTTYQDRALRTCAHYAVISSIARIAPEWLGAKIVQNTEDTVSVGPLWSPTTGRAIPVQSFNLREEAKTLVRWMQNPSGTNSAWLSGLEVAMNRILASEPYLGADNVYRDRTDHPLGTPVFLPFYMLTGLMPFTYSRANHSTIEAWANEAIQVIRHAVPNRLPLVAGLLLPQSQLGHAVSVYGMQGRDVLIADPLIEDGQLIKIPIEEFARQCVELNRSVSALAVGGSVPGQA